MANIIVYVRNGGAVSKTIAHNAHMCYNRNMDTTIRNLDERVYRSLKARAALSGKTVGEMVNEAMRAYLALPDFPTGSGSLQDLTPEEYPEGSERLSPNTQYPIPNPNPNTNTQ